MVTFDHWAIEITDNFDTLSGICVVTDHVAEADEMRAPALMRIGDDSFERLKIRVNIAENGKPHW